MISPSVSAMHASAAQRTIVSSKRPQICEGLAEEEVAGHQRVGEPNVRSAEARPRRISPPSMMSSCRSVAEWISSSAAPRSIMSRGIFAAARAKDRHRHQRSDALAAGADEVARDLGEARLTRAMRFLDGAFRPPPCPRRAGRRRRGFPRPRFSTRSSPRDPWNCRDISQRVVQCQRQRLRPVRRGSDLSFRSFAR